MREWVIKFELCENALPQTVHLCGFSPAKWEEDDFDDEKLLGHKLGSERGKAIYKLDRVTCVRVGVLLHVALLVESLVTVRTLERPSVRVDQLVRGERRAALVSLTALFAFELLAVHQMLLAVRLLAGVRRTAGLRQKR